MSAHQPIPDEHEITAVQAQIAEAVDRAERLQEVKAALLERRRAGYRLACKGNDVVYSNSPEWFYVAGWNFALAGVLCAARMVP